MKTPLQIRRDLENEIRTAFRGVALGRGISLNQARSADGLQKTAVNAQHAEITDDWSRISLEELESDCLAHLDAEGFRYYIPAMMLSVLNHYDPLAMRVIATFSGLYPKKDSWDYHIYRYSILSSEQKTAIARYLKALPKLIELSVENQKIVSRALRNYWGEYLEANTTD